MQKLGDLSNEELLVRLRGHVGKGHVWQARLLEYLAEFDARRLDRLQACSSIWDFCVRKLGMSEGEAHRRIAVARVVRRFPRALGFLERGELHLSAMYALRDHLTEENHDAFLREAVGKSTSEVNAMVAARFPKPDVPTCIEPVQPQALLPIATTGGDASTSSAPIFAAEARPKMNPLSATRYRLEVTISGEIKAKLERINDLSRHRNPSGDLETILDAALDLLIMKLEKERLGKTSRRKNGDAQAPPPPPPPAPSASSSAVANPTANTKASASSSAVANPTANTKTNTSSSAAANPTANTKTNASSNGNVHRTVAPPRPKMAPLADVPEQGCREKPAGSNLDATAARSTARLDRTKATARARVPAAVRREVFARDQERCTYVDAEGNRCPASAFLELDHIDAKARGGADTSVNLRVRCRAHNQLHAEQVFGRAYVEARIHSRRRKSAIAALAEPAPPSTPVAEPVQPVRPARPAIFETAAKALRGLGFREPEVRRALAVLETTLSPDARIETLIREALLLLT